MRISGNALRDAIISGANNISNHRRSVDELNVFPVPDGDTGTNMSMSIGNTVRELSRLQDKSVEQVADTAASALLRGARGNSGVILSLLFRGISQGFKGAEEADGNNVAVALEKGVAAAYKAVMKPTEGTILTVAREASEKAREAADAGKNAVEVFGDAIEAAKLALAKTPEILPVLKKAGVVDAGGQGLVVIFEGMYSVLKDNIMIVPENAPASAAAAPATPKNAVAEYEGEITFTYCTEFIVKRSGADTDPLRLRAYLETIGDCVVVVDDEEIIKVHVHTDHPGKALEKGLEFGQLINLKIENMRDQNERARHDAEESEKAAKAAEGSDYTPAEITKDIGFVAIAVGDGIQSLFTDLGADQIVSGGQTMNPSTDDILRAIELTPAKTVYVLPNNKNIIMAAEQAIPLSSRKVIVLHTRTIPMGISAMLAFDPDASVDENAIAMGRAAKAVGTGQITFAARDSNYDGHKIKKGELLAMKNGKVSFTDTNLTKTVVKLTRELCSKDTQFITLMYGEDVTEEQAEEARAALAAKLDSSIEINMISGGQPVYYFIISVE